MKKLFRGEYQNVWEYLLHIGPAAAFWLINFITATIIAIAIAILLWIQKR